ncbi:hypothetical protein G7B21_29385, partial [Klebsiella pneumoniae]|nr:hypothetical protein [Klebsiella pneumoniae]
PAGECRSPFRRGTALPASGRRKANGRLPRPSFYVGNATRGRVQVAISAWDCFTRVGPAEGERAIAQAIVL